MLSIVIYWYSPNPLQLGFRCLFIRGKHESMVVLSARVACCMRAYARFFDVAYVRFPPTLPPIRVVWQVS